MYEISGGGSSIGASTDLTVHTVTVTTGTITTSSPAVSSTQTWNAGGVTFTGWKLNVTDTASASGSLLVDLQVGGLNKFNIGKDGSIKINNTWTDASNYERVNLSWSSNVFTISTSAAGTGASRSLALVAASNTVLVGNGASASTYAAPLGVMDTDNSASKTIVAAFYKNNTKKNGLVVQNSGTATYLNASWAASGTGMALILGGISSGGTYQDQIQLSATGLVCFGGLTSSFPAFKQSGTTLLARLADDSADAPITVSYIRTVPVTVANLPAAATAGQGARAFVTDANATTYASTVAGGGSNKVPVYSDGTNWLIG